MKLLKHMRQAVVKRVIEDVDRPRSAALKRRAEALALRFTFARYGADVFDRCRSLPDGWLSVHKQIAIDSAIVRSFPRAPKRCGETMRCAFYAQLRYRGLELADAVTLPNSFAGTWDHSPGIPEELWSELHDLHRDAADLEEELRNLWTQTTAVLASFTTVERLAEGWPEGYGLLPQELLVETGGVPAPRIADLNARITALKEAA